MNLLFKSTVIYLAFFEPARLMQIIFALVFAGFDAFYFAFNPLEFDLLYFIVVLIIGAILGLVITEPLFWKKDRRRRR